MRIYRISVMRQLSNHLSLRHDWKARDRVPRPISVRALAFSLGLEMPGFHELSIFHDPFRYHLAMGGQLERITAASRRYLCKQRAQTAGINMAR